MKTTTLVVTGLLLAFVAVDGAYAQATATQNLTLEVQSIYRIAVSGNPGALIINDGTAGTSTLTPASDNSTNYSITQNVANTVKITAELDVAMPAGYTLEIGLASTQGSSAGTVDISSATAGSAQDVVTAISRGADANQTITYTFSADASAGPLASTSRTVTLTLTN